MFRSLLSILTRLSLVAGLPLSAQATLFQNKVLRTNQGLTPFSFELIQNLTKTSSQRQYRQTGQNRMYLL
jgi:hypothetical protein